MVQYESVKPDLERPFEPAGAQGRYDSFAKGEVFCSKKTGRLPAMGWNSWNAFGSGNTEALTKVMADKMVELGLDKLGYTYVVLDDGCYYPERIDGRLGNDGVKFPSGFKALSDYIHDRGLKFGMYNDVGTNLCAGALVGTAGFEAEDAASYIEWGVDFLKVDNCYYPWDNATFSNPENARFVYAPAIRSITLKNENNSVALSAANSGSLFGNGAYIKDGYVQGIGTFDGTGPEQTPVGELSSELRFAPDISEGEYALYVEYMAGAEPDMGAWLTIALGEGETTEVIYDDFVPSAETSFGPVNISIKKGCVIRLMNHRRQENTLASYGRLFEEIKKQAPDRDLLLSLCEWGKTQPHQWGYKVGDSWRILNDITFSVGADGDNGTGSWESDYTTGVCPQYNKAVVMDEFAGPGKGWNDPDMLMIGMNGLTQTMCRTHMAMWCMLNAPLMLGLDLRRLQKGDEIYQIIANRDLIAINQDGLGVQAKRIFTTAKCTDPSKDYIRDNKRADILAKPLTGGRFALAFFNLDQDVPCSQMLKVTAGEITSWFKTTDHSHNAFAQAEKYTLTDAFSGECFTNETGEFICGGLEPSGSLVYIIRAL